MSVRIAEWAAEVPAGVLAGSVLAVPPEDRLEAAEVLHRAGHQVHADVFLSAHGEVSGITMEVVQAIMTRVPDAKVDLHIIEVARSEKPDVALIDAEDYVLKMARELGTVSLTVPQHMFDARAASVRAARLAGLKVWAEIRPEHCVPEISEGIDGGMVMLIPPGTDHSSDHNQLAKVRAMNHLGLPIGVDGGVDREVARSALAAGATHVVSGRALFLDQG